MRSSMRLMTPDIAGGDAFRRALAKLGDDELQPGESIIALLPFATVRKRPRGPEGKVRVGIWQSWQRYRPVVVTNRRLLVFDSGRTPSPRALLAAFPLDDLSMGPVTGGRFGTSVFTLSLPGRGEVPFETGRREEHDLEVLQAKLVRSQPGSRAP